MLDLHKYEPIPLFILIHPHKLCPTLVFLPSETSPQIRDAERVLTKQSLVFHGRKFWRNIHPRLAAQRIFRDRAPRGCGGVCKRPPACAAPSRLQPSVPSLSPALPRGTWQRHCSGIRRNPGTDALPNHCRFIGKHPNRGDDITAIPAERPTAPNGEVKSRGRTRGRKHELRHDRTKTSRHLLPKF